MSSTDPKTFIKGVYTFSDGYGLRWHGGNDVPEGVPVGIVIIDTSLSMQPHKQALKMAVASILHDTNVPKDFKIPEPRGCTGMVYAIEQIMSSVGSKQATTIYLVGDGGENMYYGSLPIGLDAKQDIIKSPYLDFRAEPLPVQDRATHYRALVNFMKFKRITLVMLALGDGVKCFLGGLANTKDIYLAHLDFEEDIDNMMQIATLLKKQSRKGVVQTTLIQVDEADKKKGAQRKMTSQGQQKLQTILGNISVGNPPRDVCNGAKQLEEKMNSVIDAYIAEPKASPCAEKIGRAHV